jgi:hypothetical protein
MISDEELLKLCAEERKNGIGFETDSSGELSADREKALSYFKGEMSDVPHLANRSRAVDSSVADAIHTAIPDLMEIFIGGDDVVNFPALSAEDEDQAKVETETVIHVVMEMNNSFEFLLTGIQDSLLTKLGVWKAWVEDEEETEEDLRDGIPMELKPVAKPFAQMVGFDDVETEDAEDGQTFSATLRKTKTTSCIKIAAWPSEDFAHARDARNLRTAQWFALRSRPRAQSLLDDGYDAEKVEELQGFSKLDEEVGQARDTAGEGEQHGGQNSGMLRTVEIVEHFIRCDADEDGKSELWRVVAGNDDKVLLEKEQIDFPSVAVITPYMVPHRLLGQSLADHLLEIQRIKTALLRMLLDSGYFALNQRYEVAEDRMSIRTLSDLMRNEPMAPVVSKTGDAVRPLSAGGLAFDVPGALEFMSTVAENRTGIVRNAQGLNPDTLHDTAEGSRALIGAAQKRIRLVARTIAETGFKDLCLIVHQLLRKHGDEMDGYVVGRKGQTVNPKQWRARKALRCEIGVGSGGREHDLMAGNALMAMLEKVVQAQGGLDGPITTAEGVKAAAKRQTERLGFRNAETYFPEQPPPDPNAQPPVPPEVQAAQMKVQSEQQIAQAKLAAEQQSSQMKMASDGQITQQKMAGEAELEQFRIASQERVKLRELEMAHEFKVQQASAELQLREKELAAERDLKWQIAQLDAVTRQQSTVSESLPDIEQGGEPG